MIGRTTEFSFVREKIDEEEGSPYREFIYLPHEGVVEAQKWV